MPKSNQKRKKTKQWAQRHVNDNYVKKAQQAGFRARAAFKLTEIQQKHRLLKSGMTVLDLGAAPGSWSQIAIKTVGAKGKVVAVDLLKMKPIENVAIIEGDFCDSAIQQKVDEALAGELADVVISDMSPDLTGIRITDQANMEALLNSVIELLPNYLKPNGDLLIKVFEGQLLEEIRKPLKASFSKLISVKPEASRNQSREFYLLAKQYRSN